ncbi:ArsR/SmtB family transcription factor [Phytomonospora endophytica]|uniref:DNA-binding transcriptional ArsR family regulator n=1 Tax=Phytomonospora endophytica TaxID=714109 RepID=A0A841FWX5_9ACTN|nr:winged helix-turn-helix domain-containing protein [Phytomonospora endophytica]MBB6037847.1 DNA-binding transcriptional ArsR family regulator [Phytomonospora endophytica]
MRTRLAARADPLWDLMLAVHMIRGQPGDLLHSGWRRQAVAALRRGGMSGRLGLLSALVPTLGYFPDFLNPPEAATGLAHGLEAIRSTPIRTLTRELARLDVKATARADVRLLASGDPRALAVLTDGISAFHAAAIAPHQRELDKAVNADLTARAAALAENGVEGLFGSLHPMATWSAGELRIPGHPHQVIELRGRGLTLVPSAFCVRHPMTLFDEGLPPVLVYPVAPATGALAPGNTGLHALIGTTRAAVLDAIGTGCGTTELAARAGVAPASASEHAAVLRAAGLITSHRDRNRMLHRLTGMGRALLEGP